MCTSPSQTLWPLATLHCLYVQPMITTNRIGAASSKAWPSVWHKRRAYEGTILNKAGQDVYSVPKLTSGFDPGSALDFNQSSQQEARPACGWIPLLNSSQVASQQVGLLLKYDLAPAVQLLWLLTSYSGCCCLCQRNNVSLTGNVSWISWSLECHSILISNKIGIPLSFGRPELGVLHSFL